MRDRPDFWQAEEVLLRSLERGVFPSASMLVGQGRRVLYRRAFGRLSIGENAPETNLVTRYDMASITKILTVGMLSLRALESGRLCLWDTLETFLEAPKDKQGITIAQLLTHASGFTSGLHLWLTPGVTPDNALDALLATPLLFEPGTHVQYSCAGFILLGMLLERLYGLSLDQLAEREVFRPLGMRHTGYCPAPGNIAATERQPDGTFLQGVVHDENARFLGGAAGNAGVFSTLDDMALFLQMLADGGRLSDGTRYLNAGTLRTAMQNRTPGLEQGRGLAFYLPRSDNGYIGDLFPDSSVGHTGFTGTSFTLDPETGLYLILLTNRVCPTRESTAIYRVRRLVHNAVYAAAFRD